MSRWHSYLNSSVKIIRAYHGAMPFSMHLKDFFRQEKKMGGTDRKWIRQFCFSFFRMGISLPGISIEDSIKAGLFLCNNENADWQILLNEDWKTYINRSLQERIKFLKNNFPGFVIEHIFPFTEELDKTIDVTAFAASHLQQPDVFIRIRPGKKELVIESLNQKEIPYSIVEENCLAFKPDIKLEDILHVGKDVIIQDYSSQLVHYFFRNISPKKIWDCCAGSGGKSILAKDLFKDAALFESDTRENILHNLSNRFRAAGITDYHLLLADLTKEHLQLEEKFDLVICDAPCSGSGTWGRSPENLVFFSIEKLNHYISLQRKIIKNAIQQVAEEGYFLYITCSVYEEENNGAIEFILQNFPFIVIEKKMIQGFEHRADTMFTALLRRK